MRGGRRRRGKGGGGEETESEGGIRSMGWMRETEQEGRGLIGGGDKLAFLSKLTTHISLNKN